jgi:hypothetical protein
MVNFWPRVTDGCHPPARAVSPSSSPSSPQGEPVLALGGWLWRQPLVHFLLLGALLFGLYGVVQGAAVPSTVAPTVTLDSPTLACIIHEACQKAVTWPPMSQPQQRLSINVPVLATT